MRIVLDTNVVVYAYDRADPRKQEAAIAKLYAFTNTIQKAQAGSDASPEARAIALYDAGDYTGALSLLEQLDASGAADGPLLHHRPAQRDVPASGLGFTGPTHFPGQSKNNGRRTLQMRQSSPNGQKHRRLLKKIIIKNS